MRQRNRVSRGSRYGKANKLDMGWGEAGERQKHTSVRLAYVTLLCASPIMSPPSPHLWSKDTFLLLTSGPLLPSVKWNHFSSVSCFGVTNPVSFNSAGGFLGAYVKPSEVHLSEHPRLSDLLSSPGSQQNRRWSPRCHSGP